MEPVGLGRNIGSHVALYLNGDDERVSRAALIAAQFITLLEKRNLPNFIRHARARARALFLEPSKSEYATR
jgi:hypothetical protein